MNIQTLAQKIHNEIQDISRLSENIKRYQQVSKIEVDLLKSKVQTLYDDVLQLEYIKETTKPLSPKEKVAQDKYLEITPDFIDDCLIGQDSESHKELETETNQDNEDEDASSNQKVVVVKSKGSEKQRIEIKPEVPSVKITDNTKVDSAVTENVVFKSFKPDSNDDVSIAESLAEKTVPSINDILKDSQKAKDLASKYIDQPISNLKANITINNKIWYIKELFNEDADLFNQSLSDLNKMNNLDQALQYINQHFNWNQEEDSFLSFIELVFRRFVIVEK